MYKLIKNENGETSVIQKLDGNIFIPLKEDNYHYQEYLKWVEEGNTPEPADE